MHVNNRTPFSWRSLHMLLAFWIQGVQQLIMARWNSVDKEEQGNQRWDPLSYLPPLYLSLGLELMHFPLWNSDPPLPSCPWVKSCNYSRETADSWQSGGYWLKSSSIWTEICELEQCKGNIINFPFPKSNSINPTNTYMYPLREVPMLPGDIGYVNSPLTSGVRNFKRKWNV